MLSLAIIESSRMPAVITFAIHVESLKYHQISKYLANTNSTISFIHGIRAHNSTSARGKLHTWYTCSRFHKREWRLHLLGNDCHPMHELLEQPLEHQPMHKLRDNDPPCSLGMTRSGGGPASEGVGAWVSSRRSEMLPPTHTQLDP